MRSALRAGIFDLIQFLLHRVVDLIYSFAAGHINVVDDPALKLAAGGVGLSAVFHCAGRHDAPVSFMPGFQQITGCCRHPGCILILAGRYPRRQIARRCTQRLEPQTEFCLLRDLLGLARRQHRKLARAVLPPQADRKSGHRIFDAHSAYVGTGQNGISSVDKLADAEIAGLFLAVNCDGDRLRYAGLELLPAVRRGFNHVLAARACLEADVLGIGIKHSFQLCAVMRDRAGFKRARQLDCDGSAGAVHVEADRRSDAFDSDGRVEWICGGAHRVIEDEGHKRLLCILVDDLERFAGQIFLRYRIAACQIVGNEIGFRRLLVFVAEGALIAVAHGEAAHRGSSCVDSDFENSVPLVIAVGK